METKSHIYLGGTQSFAVPKGYQRHQVVLNGITTSDVTCGILPEGGVTEQAVTLEAAKVTFTIKDFSAESISLAGAAAGTYPVTIISSNMGQ